MNETLAISIWMDGGILLFCAGAAFLTGAALGSFVNCAAFRIVRGESFVKGRSRCPDCGHFLTAGELVPVLSWLFQKGKCRNCGSKIPVRYPASELFFAVCTVLCLLRFDLTPLFLRNLFFGGCLFCLSLTDLEARIIPDGCLITAALAWVLFFPFTGGSPADAARQILAGLTFGGVLLFLSLAMDRILQKESLGGGDIKLFAVTGLYLGFIGSLFTLLLSSVLGLLTGGILKMGRKGKDGAFPFGPAVSLAAWIMLLYGEPLIRWYLALLY